MTTSLNRNYNLPLTANRTYNIYTGVIDEGGTSYDASPGVLSCFSLFTSLFNAIKVLISSFKINDKEGFVEALVRVLNLPLGIACSLERLITFSMLLISGISIITLSLTAAVTGFVFLGIEFCLEVYRLIRTLMFSSNYEIKTVLSHIKKLEEKKTALNSASILAEQTKLADRALFRIYNGHFNLPEKDQIIKINKLSRIIRPFAVVDFRAKTLIDGGLNEKKDILELLNTQINKALIIHVVAIAAILLAVVSLALAFLGCPPLAFVTIGLIGAAIELPRYLAPAAFLDQPGYRWSFTACLPKCFQPRTSSGH